MRPRILLLAALAVAVATPALPQNIQIPGMGMQPGAAELQILNSIRSRDAFQQEQRIHREIDRVIVQQPAPQPNVPRVKPTCQEDTKGQKLLRSCR